VGADSVAAGESKSTPKIFAVSLEGKFRSAYENRCERQKFPNFRAESPDNKMIVIADGDVGRNQIYKGTSLPLGEDLLTKQSYGNRQFLQNALDFLLDDDNLMELRNRDLQIRLLDRAKIDEERSYWRWITILIPLAIIAAVGGLFHYLRQRRFA